MGSKRTAEQVRRRNQLVVAHYHQVETIAWQIYRRVPPFSLELSDLKSAGAEGLIDAADKFNPDHGVEFGAYAEYRIRGAILDELRNIDRLTRDQRRNSKRINESYERLSVKIGRRPTDEELAVDLQISVKSLAKQKLDAVNTTMMPIDAIDRNRKGSQNSVLETTEDNLFRQKAKPILEKLIRAKLPQRTQEILLMHYFAGMTLKKIAARLDITESRVCQLHREALGILRRKITPDLGTVPELRATEGKPVGDAPEPKT